MSCGLATTSIVHIECAPSDAPQVVAPSENTPAETPVLDTVIASIGAPNAPALRSTTGTCATLPTSTLPSSTVGASWRSGMPPWAVIPSSSVPPAGLAIVKLAVRSPAAAAWNTSSIVQVAPGASDVAAQVVVGSSIARSPAFAPPIEIEIAPVSAVPVLWTTTPTLAAWPISVGGTSMEVSGAPLASVAASMAIPSGMDMAGFPPQPAITITITSALCSVVIGAPRVAR